MYNKNVDVHLYRDCTENVQREIFKTKMSLKKILWIYLCLYGFKIQKWTPTLGNDFYSLMRV